MEPITATLIIRDLSVDQRIIHKGSESPYFYARKIVELNRAKLIQTFNLQSCFVNFQNDVVILSGDPTHVRNASLCINSMLSAPCYVLTVPDDIVVALRVLNDIKRDFSIKTGCWLHFIYSSRTVACYGMDMAFASPYLQNVLAFVDGCKSPEGRNGVFVRTTSLSSKHRFYIKKNIDTLETKTGCKLAVASCEYVPSYITVQILGTDLSIHKCLCVLHSVLGTGTDAREYREGSPSRSEGSDSNASESISTSNPSTNPTQPSTPTEISAEDIMPFGNTQQTTVHIIGGNNDAPVMVTMAACNNGLLHAPTAAANTNAIGSSNGNIMASHHHAINPIMKGRMAVSRALPPKPLSPTDITENGNGLCGGLLYPHEHTGIPNGITPSSPLSPFNEAECDELIVKSLSLEDSVHNALLNTDMWKVSRNPSPTGSEDPIEDTTPHTDMFLPLALPIHHHDSVGCEWQHQLKKTTETLMTAAASAARLDNSAVLLHQPTPQWLTQTVDSVTDNCWAPTAQLPSTVVDVNSLDKRQATNLFVHLLSNLCLLDTSENPSLNALLQQLTYLPAVCALQK